MVAQKCSPRAGNDASNPGDEDVLVRILRSLDQAASKTPVSSS